MFKYELHLHTKETSRCGHVWAADQVRTYKELGFAGICVTDHFHNTFFKSLDCADDWDACMDVYLRGYRAAKEAGDRLGLDVILGLELRFPENDSDYLVYGVDEAWLRANPWTTSMDHQSFYDRYRDEVLIIHAHPYRYCDIVYYDCVHGLEIANCNPRHDSRNHLALELARANPHLIRTTGSDAHRPGDEGRGCVAFEERVRDSFEMKEALVSRRFRNISYVYEDIIKEGERIGNV